MFGYYGIPYGVFTWEKPWFLRLCSLQKRDTDTAFLLVTSSTKLFNQSLALSERADCLYSYRRKTVSLVRVAPRNLIGEVPPVSCAGARRLSSAFGRRRSPGSSAGSLPLVRRMTCRFGISFDGLAAWSRRTAPCLREGLHFWNSCSRSRTGWCTARKRVPRRRPTEGSCRPHSCSRAFWWVHWSALTALAWFLWPWFSPPHDLLIHWFTEPDVFSESSFFVPAPVRRHRKVISHSDRYSIFKVQWKGLSLIPTGRGQMHPLNGKIFLNEKTSSLIWTKGAECTPNFRLSPKNFLRKFIPSLVPTGKHQIIGCFWKIFYLVKSLSLIWNYKSQWHPISQKKWENIFYPVAGGFTFLPKKPLHLFGIERSKRTLFFRKKAKIFWKDGLSQKHPLTCSHWQRTFGDSNFEKE